MQKTILYFYNNHQKEQIMILFLTSQGTISEYQNDIKVGAELNPANNFIQNLKQYAPNAKKFVYVANNPDNFEDNDMSGEFVYNAFKHQGFFLESLLVLDNRTLAHIAEIQTADIVFLRGGTLERQIDFFKNSGIAKQLETTKAVIIGQSAGSMVLSQNVYQYPETEQEFALPRFINGLGFFDTMLIPHFNPQTGNEICDGSFNTLVDFFIPDSQGRQFLALQNGSYIIKSNSTCQLFGNAYTLQNGKVEQICQNNQTIDIEI